jgi:hypothetical protein
MRRPATVAVSLTVTVVCCGSALSIAKPRPSQLALSTRSTVRAIGAEGGRDAIAESAYAALNCSGDSSSTVTAAPPPPITALLLRFVLPLWPEQVNAPASLSALRWVSPFPDFCVAAVGDLCHFFGHTTEMRMNLDSDSVKSPREVRNPRRVACITGAKARALMHKFRQVICISAAAASRCDLRRRDSQDNRFQPGI